MSVSTGEEGRLRGRGVSGQRGAVGSQTGLKRFKFIDLINHLTGIMSLPFFKSFYLYLEQTGGSHEQTKSFPICKQSNDGVNSDPPQKKPHDVIILYLFIVFSIYVYKYKKSMFLE